MVEHEYAAMRKLYDNTVFVNSNGNIVYVMCVPNDVFSEFWLHSQPNTFTFLRHLRFNWSRPVINHTGSLARLANGTDKEYKDKTRWHFISPRKKSLCSDKEHIFSAWTAISEQWNLYHRLWKRERVKLLSGRSDNWQFNFLFLSIR